MGRDKTQSFNVLVNSIHALLVPCLSHYRFVFFFGLPLKLANQVLDFVFVFVLFHTS